VIFHCCCRSTIRHNITASATAAAAVVAAIDVIADAAESSVVPDMVPDPDGGAVTATVRPMPTNLMLSSAKRATVRCSASLARSSVSTCENLAVVGRRQRADRAPLTSRPAPLATKSPKSFRMACILSASVADIGRRERRLVDAALSNHRRLAPRCCRSRRAR
jgi:hypothetical protein